MAAAVYRAGAICHIKSQDFVRPNYQFHVNLGLEELGKANTTTQLKNNAIVGVWLTYLSLLLTTEGSGTITEYTPGSTIILKETSGPRTYHFGKTVTYVTRSGKTLDEDTVRTRVKVGIPVRVHYVGTGDNIMVDRVILDED